MVDVTSPNVLGAVAVCLDNVHFDGAADRVGRWEGCRRWRGCSVRCVAPCWSATTLPTRSPHDIQRDDRSPPCGDRVLRRQRRRRRRGRLGAERGSPGGDPRRRPQRGRSFGVRRRPGDRSAAAGRGTGRSRVAARPGRRRSDVAQCRRVQRRTSAGDARGHLRRDRGRGPDPGRRDRPPDRPARPDPRQPGLGRGGPRRRHRRDCLGDRRARAVLGAARRRGQLRRRDRVRIRAAPAARRLGRDHRLPAAAHARRDPTLPRRDGSRARRADADVLPESPEGARGSRVHHRLLRRRRRGRRGGRRARCARACRC